MTDILSSTSAARRLTLGRSTWPALLYAAAGLSGVGSFAIGAASTEVAGYDSHLSLLLRFMAILKGLTVLGAIGLAGWRFRAPIGGASALSYIGATALMAAAPGLIWSLGHIALGAICFHLGLFAYLVVALRDDAVGRVFRRDRR